VPELLPDAKRRKGRYPAYDAVNPSRPSSTGRPHEQRNRNLGIVGTGIKDFGTGKSYSPLDLVMAVRSSSLAEAFCWLEEKLLPQKPDVEIDIDACIEAQDAPSIAPEREPEPQESDPDMSEAELTMLGPVWEFGDPVPPEEPMLVPVFVPARPLLGYIGGQRSTFKTFVTNDLAVAIASGGEFAGQKVAYPGLVVQVELEGSLSKVSAQHGNNQSQCVPVAAWQGAANDARRRQGCSPTRACYGCVGGRRSAQED
jgi:hypothetical protein